MIFVVAIKTKIRQMQKKDLKKLSEIYAEVYATFNVGERWTESAAKKLLAHWLEKQPDLALVAECNGKIAGAFVAGVKPWWDGNHLSDGEIFVRPKFQSKGIGKELSKALYAKALKKYKVVCWDAYTFKKTKFPLCWYESQGFKVNKDWVMIFGSVKKALSNLRRNH